MPKITISKNKLLVPLIIFFLFFAIFPASAQLDLSSFFNPLQQSSTPKPPAPTLTPSEISLVWSTTTNIPPDYLGKALPSYNSLVEVSAVQVSPTKVSLAELNYKWFLDGSFQEYNSGQNRARFLFRVSVLGGQQQNVSLQIEDSLGQPVLNLSTLINVVNPEAIIYPLGNQTINFIQTNSEENILAPDQEKTFIALPYFFDINSPLSLDFQWNLNGQKVNKAEEKNKFTVRMAAGDLQEAFIQPISVLVINPRNEIQRAVGKLDITVKK